MTVLVSGASGFIGRSLCTYLYSLGWGVVPSVRKPSGVEGEHILTDRASWLKAMSGCSCVVNLAGCSRVSAVFGGRALQSLRASNWRTAVDLADLAVEAGVRRYVFISTVKVNGELTAPGASFKADDPPLPMSPYAISKWEAETSLLDIARRTGLEVVIIRPPIVYGPGVKGNFASLIALVNSGVPLPFAAIDNCRSMLALENLLDFIVFCADIEKSPAARNQIFLLSDGEDLSTTELLRRVAWAYGRTCRMFPFPEEVIISLGRLLRVSSIADRLLRSLVIDVSKAHTMLGWRPPISVNEQLKRMAYHDSCN